MIDPHWSVIDLDPHTWRTIGSLFDPGQYIRTSQNDEHGLFVLHSGGRPLRVVDTATGVRRDLPIEQVDDPRALASHLFATGEWQRVHIIDKRHLAHVAKEAQSNPRRDLTLDQYYHLVYNLLWDGSGGYVSFPEHPGHWHGWVYHDLNSFIAALPNPSTVALIVLDGSRTSIGLVLDISDRLIRTVTTLETFDPSPTVVAPPTFDLTATDFRRLWALLQARYERGSGSRPVAALLCAHSVFSRWLDEPTQAGKRQILEKARDLGEAFWRIDLRA